MAEPVFYDPRRRRWKRLRRLADVIAALITLLIVFFSLSVFRGESLPKVFLQAGKRPLKALKEKERRHPKRISLTRRGSAAPPSQVALNTGGEGIRAAFYVDWDAASFSSLRDFLPQIDLLFPEWLHVLTADGRLQAVTPDNHLFDEIRSGHAQHVDDKVMPFLRAEKAEDRDVPEVFPLVNNFDPVRNDWASGIGAFLNDPAARLRFRQEIATFLGSDNYRGLTLDFEAIPLSAQPGFRALVQELEADLHSRGMKLYVAVPANNEDFNYHLIGQYSDGVILMNYDEHFPGGDPGPLASQDWFTHNLEVAKKVIPPEKLICAIANYGYDWSLGDKKRKIPPKVTNRSVQEAWIDAADAEAQIDFDSDALNPHFAYSDDDNVRHELWFTDAASALDQMRGAQRLGINTFALWRLGSEDRSLWSVWDHPEEANAPDKLRDVPPGQDVDMEGQGDILRITARPRNGARTITTDAQTGLVSDEFFDSLPTPYEVTQFGAVPKQVALSFDDGPDPTFTPKVLDILKQENVKGTFFIIGAQAEKFAPIVRRVYREGHEIGNHTWSHPDISNIYRTYMRLELNLTERFFAAQLGVKPLLFRAPYSIDQEPDTADQVRPLETAQEMGYIAVGDKIDPDDWQQKSAEQITADVVAQLGRGNVILLHDGGGDRGETVRALPMIIQQVRARGYQFVSVSQLLGKSRNEIMPPLSANERWSAKLNYFGFWIYGVIIAGIVYIFFVGDVLMTGRLLVIGLLAIFDRVRTSRKLHPGTSAFQPALAVLVPAYNEEKVIERTVRSLLRSDYPNLRVIVIDDGSQDNTLQIAREKFQHEVDSGRVLVLTQPNSGKAEALNFGLQYVTEELFVGIDADTIIAPDAISMLVPNFVDPKVGALAGNAKVGNRVNLWTRWQALEYVTSQNFERRALNALGAVSVVPGAIGAWRTAAVRELGGYHTDTVAEDADLTMRLLRAGYRVQYEDRALAFTEAPTSAKTLMRQRFRWSFGILQAVYKNRQAFFRGGALGWVALPNIVIFQILLPLLSPFIDLMFLFGLLDYTVDRHFHPLTANPASLHRLLVFFLAFLIIDFLASAIAFSLERRNTDRRESVWLLGHVWLQRFAYRQVFSWVLIKTLKRAVEGGHFSWDKLERTATVKDIHPEEVAVK